MIDDISYTAAITMALALSAAATVVMFALHPAAGPRTDESMDRRAH